MANSNANVTRHYLSVSDFKKTMSVDTLDILKNENTGKLFVSLTFNDGSKANVRCQQDIDLSDDAIKLLIFMTTATDRRGAADWYESCLINGKENAGATHLKTL